MERKLNAAGCFRTALSDECFLRICVNPNKPDGAAADAAGLVLTDLVKQAIKTSPAGTYSLNNTTTGHYLWLCVPNTMTIKKVTSGGFDVPMEAAQSSTTAVDTYKCYRSSSPINQGAMNIVVS